MEILNEYDLIQAMSGVTEDGEGKCLVSVQLHRSDSDGNLREIEPEFSTEKPIVQAFKQAGGFVLVDLIFNSVEDYDLREIYSYLSTFFQASNSVSDDELDFPLLTVSIFPSALNGEMWMVGLNQIFYSLTPEDSLGEPRIIRMAFMCQDDQDSVPNCLFLRTSDEEIEKVINKPKENDATNSIIM